MDENPLGLDPETMRLVGYLTVDMLVDRLSAVAEGPTNLRTSRAEMERRLTEPPPEMPRSYEEILDSLDRVAISGRAQVGDDEMPHPGLARPFPPRRPSSARGRVRAPLRCLGRKPHGLASPHL
jgi:hypothetical protein